MHSWRERGAWRPVFTMAGLLVAATACGSWRPAGTKLPPPAALAELELAPPRDLAARNAAGDTVWLRHVAALTGRAAAGTTGDTLVFTPDGLRRVGGGREVLPRGLTVRLPRDPAAGIRLRVERPDMRPDMLVVGVVLGTLAGIGLYVGYGL